MDKDMPTSPYGITRRQIKDDVLMRVLMRLGVSGEVVNRIFYEQSNNVAIILPFEHPDKSKGEFRLDAVFEDRVYGYLTNEETDYRKLHSQIMIPFEPSYQIWEQSLRSALTKFYREGTLIEFLDSHFECLTVSVNVFFNYLCEFLKNENEPITQYGFSLIKQIVDWLKMKNADVSELTTWINSGGLYSIVSTSTDEEPEPTEPGVKLSTFQRLFLIRILQKNGLFPKKKPAVAPKEELEFIGSITGLTYLGHLKKANPEVEKLLDIDLTGSQWRQRIKDIRAVKEVVKTMDLPEVYALVSKYESIAIEKIESE